MKSFISAVLIAAAIITPNAVIAQTTTTAPTEMTMAPTTEMAAAPTTQDGAMMNNSMGMETSNDDMDGDSDMIAGTASNTTSETPVGSESGSGPTAMNASGDAATGTSKAVNTQSITLTMSAIATGMAIAFVF